MGKAKVCEEKVVHMCLTQTIVVILVFVPFGTWFAVHFWKKLNAMTSESTSAMSSATVLAIKLFIIMTTAKLWQAIYMAASQFLFANTSESSLTLAHCASLYCLVFIESAVAYVAFQRVLLERLKVSFAATKHPLSATVFSTFAGIQVIWLLVAVAMSIWVWTTPCLVENHFFELSNYESYTCTIKNNASLIAFFVAFLIVCDIALVWMYVWRLKAVFIDANYYVLSLSTTNTSNTTTANTSTAATKTMTITKESEESQPYANELRHKAKFHVIVALDLMRKCTVIAVWSVGASIALLALQFIPVSLWTGLLDCVVKGLLLYCWFEFGDDLYGNLLGFCHFTVDCCLPKRALELECDFMDKVYSEMEATSVVTDDVKQLPSLPLSVGAAMALTPGNRSPNTELTVDFDRTTTTSSILVANMYSRAMTLETTSPRRDT